eukprot:989767-Rhodomonas_salina.3
MRGVQCQAGIQGEERAERKEESGKKGMEGRTGSRRTGRKKWEKEGEAWQLSPQRRCLQLEEHRSRKAPIIMRDVNTWHRMPSVLVNTQFSEKPPPSTIGIEEAC